MLSLHRKILDRCSRIPLDTLSSSSPASRSIKEQRSHLATLRFSIEDIIMRFFKWESPKAVQTTLTHVKGGGGQRPTIFSHLSEHDLSQLYHAAHIKYFQKDQCIIKEGDECDCLNIVLDGHAIIVYRINM